MKLYIAVAILLATVGAAKASVLDRSDPVPLYYVEDGCQNEHAKLSEGDVQDDYRGSYHDKDYLAFVRCCSMPSGDADAVNVCTTISDCEKDEEKTTYIGAVKACRAEGQRLCTKEEMLDDICCKSGGMCDNSGVWTSTMIFNPKYWVDDGCHTEHKKESDENVNDDVEGAYQEPSFKAFVRCCSKDGKTCTTVSDCEEPSDATTYDDAADQCFKLDQRLCTKHEILSELCCKTGGKCDDAAIWTSSLDTDDEVVDESED